MNASSEPDAEELIVKAKYFAPIDVEEANLKKFQHELVRILQQEGYRQSDTELIPWGSTQRTMDFYLYDGIPIGLLHNSVKHVEDKAVKKAV